MGFSCKIILAQHTKENKVKRVYLQAIINRKLARVPLGFYLEPDAFDERRQCMKAWHPNKKNYDTEFQMAIAKANNIASKFRIDGKWLTPREFREEYTNPTTSIDLIKFMKDEIDLKRPKLAHNTYKQHKTALNKLKGFKKVIPFGMITIDLMQQFQNHLIKGELIGKENKRKVLAAPTINKLLKIIKQYLLEARIKGYVFKDPFVAIKIKTFKSNRLALSELELDRLEKYYDSADCLPKHRKLLQYFLFSCYTGLRISDVTVITWNQLHDNLLIFTPVKTKYNQQEVTVPLSAKSRKYLSPFPLTKEWKGKQTIFETFADPVSNRYLKEIADLHDIRKKVTYHTSRHTFGSLFADGGDIVAMQKIMGHGDIKTSMGYVHTNTKQLINAMKARFGE